MSDKKRTLFTLIFMVLIIAVGGLRAAVLPTEREEDVAEIGDWMTALDANGDVAGYIRVADLTGPPPLDLEERMRQNEAEFVIEVYEQPGELSPRIGTTGEHGFVRYAEPRTR